MHQAKFGQIFCDVLPCLCAGTVLRLLLELGSSTKNVHCGFSHFPFIFVGRPASRDLYHRRRAGKCSSPSAFNRPKLQHLEYPRI